MTSSPIHELLAKQREALRAFAERRLGSRAAAEDVVQRAAVRALAQQGQLRDVAAGRAWLFRITRRLIADELRARPAPAEPSEEVPAPDVSEGGVGCTCVLANLARLPPAHASLLRRAIIDGVTTSQLAVELDVTVNAATVRLSRARAALRDQLRGHCGTRSLRDCIDCPCNTRDCCSG